MAFHKGTEVAGVVMSGHIGDKGRLGMILLPGRTSIGMADNQCEAPLSEVTSMARWRNLGRADLRIEASSKAFFFLHCACTAFFRCWMAEQVSNKSWSWSTIKVVRGLHTSLECLCSLTNVVVGLMIPNPPSQGGRASTDLTPSPGTGLPVSDGRKYRKISVSRGWRWSTKSPVTRAKNTSLPRSACVNAEGAAFRASWTIWRVQAETFSLRYSSLNFEVPKGVPRSRRPSVVISTPVLWNVVVASSKCKTSSHVNFSNRSRMKLRKLYRNDPHFLSVLSK